MIPHFSIRKSFRNIHRITPLLIVLSLFCVSCNKESTTPYKQLRERYYNMLAPSDTDQSDNMIRSRIDALDKSAAAIWESLNKAPGRDYLWDKINYIPGKLPLGSVSSKVTGGFGKLSHLATAYRTKGSKYENNPRLKKDILDGIDWILANQYNPSVQWYDNWWDWVIGIPMTMNNLLVLMYDDLSENQLKAAIEAVNFFAPNVSYEGASTGANKIWQCKIMAMRGIIAQSPEQIKMAVDGLDSEFKYVTTKDGFYKDGSFVQHQWHPYTGGYGRSMLRELSDIIIMVQGSEWEVPVKHQTMIYEWIHNSFEPVIYRGALMDMIRGREASRAESDRAAGHSLLLSLIRLSEIAPEAEKKRLQSYVKENMLTDTERPFLDDVPTYLLPAAKKILNDPAVVPAGPKTLNKVFAAMDRAVHIRPGFAFGVSLSSSRIENYETINGENLRGWYTGDGMTYLYDNDLKQYSDGLWPTINAYRLPGTTEDTRPREAKTLPFGEGILYADGYKSPKDWVGGTSICNSYGMVGMWYKAQDCTLEARKSWFMAGDEIVALGAGISSKDKRTIETTVENRKLNEGSVYHLKADSKEILLAERKPLLTKCQWFHFDGVNEQSAIGYYFPEQTTLNMQKETRTGSWYEINQPYSPQTGITKEYLTLWVDHGKNPDNATYAYVLLPGKSAIETRQYAQKPNITILANTPQVQAVYHTGEQLTGVNFWEAPFRKTAGVTVDNPASVIMKETKGQLIVGVSDPTQKNNTITVIFDRSVSGSVDESPDVKILSVSPLKLQVNVAGAIGATKTVTLTTEQ